MNSRIKSSFEYLIAGDAVAYPLEGLTSLHIKSVFKKLESIVDPEPALKGKMEKWRKPGLYSSVTQFAIILCSSVISNRKKPLGAIEDFERKVAGTPEISDSQSGIFRGCSNQEKIFISKLKNPGKEHPDQPAPVSRIIPAFISAGFTGLDTSRIISSAVSFSRKFSGDIHTTSALALYAKTVSRIIEEEKDASDIIECSIECADEILENINSAPGAVFDMGINPDRIVSSVSIYSDLFKKIFSSKTSDEAVAAIVAALNKELKSPATRPTIDHPLCILPFAVYLSCREWGADESIFINAMNGGTGCAYLSTAASLYGAAADIQPDTGIMSQISNKKRISAIIDSFSNMETDEDLIDDFISSEYSISMKEIEELRSRTKHLKAQPKEKSKYDITSQLSKHVVESWTKIDKARWKKEKKRKENEK